MKMKILMLALSLFVFLLPSAHAQEMTVSAEVHRLWGTGNYGQEFMGNFSANDSVFVPEGKTIYYNLESHLNSQAFIAYGNTFISSYNGVSTNPEGYIVAPPGGIFLHMEAQIYDVEYYNLAAVFVYIMD